MSKEESIKYKDINSRQTSDVMLISDDEKFYQDSCAWSCGGYRFSTLHKRGNIGILLVLDGNNFTCVNKK